MMPFAEYHAKYPQIYEAFKKLTFEAIAKGFERYSSKSIFELIRWHTGVGAKKEKFKLNNIYTPHYARLFVQEHPQHQNFFEFRRHQKPVNPHLYVQV